MKLARTTESSFSTFNAFPISCHMTEVYVPQTSLSTGIVGRPSVEHGSARMLQRVHFHHGSGASSLQNGKPLQPSLDLGPGGPP
jgi:hypothetical protein